MTWLPALLAVAGAMLVAAGALILARHRHRHRVLVALGLVLVLAGVTVAAPRAVSETLSAAVSATATTLSSLRGDAATASGEIAAAIIDGQS